MTIAIITLLNLWTITSSEIMAKNTARIDNWFKIGNCLWGNVSEHSIREFDPGCLQRTSDIVSIDESAGVAETMNTHYILGKKQEDI